MTIIEHPKNYDEFYMLNGWYETTLPAKSKLYWVEYTLGLPEVHITYPELRVLGPLDSYPYAVMWALVWATVFIPFICIKVVKRIKTAVTVF